MSVVSDQLQDLDLVPSDWQWRPGQQQLAQAIIDAPTKVVLVQAETGIGKSLAPVAALKAANKRGIVLVQTRQLERQYLAMMNSLVLMEGRRHFACEITGGQAHEAPCTVGARCTHAGLWQGAPVIEPTCPYYIQKFAARQAQVSVHNYAYWLGETQTPSSAFKRTDWLICDEAHELDSILMDAGIIELPRSHARQAAQLPRSGSIEQWQGWAVENEPGVRARHDQARGELLDAGLVPGTGTEDTINSVPMEAPISDPRTIDLLKQVRYWDTLLTFLLDLARIKDTTQWVQKHDGRTLRFCPIYGEHGFQRILKAANKVVLMSAFLAPTMLARTLNLDPEDYTLIEPSSGFDRTKSPVLWLPTTRMSIRTADAEWRVVVEVIDRLIDHYAPKKGLIHVPSYKLRDFIAGHSRHQDLLFTYDRGEKDATIERFVNASKGVLLGQSISTGVDIPYEPQFNIIVKLPTLPTQDPVISARSKVDPDFVPFKAICEVVQATGRVKRAADHDGPTIILDWHFGWFHRKHKEDFPQWFEHTLTQNYNGYPTERWDLFPDIKRDLPRIRAGAAIGQIGAQR